MSIFCYNIWYLTLVLDMELLKHIISWVTGASFFSNEVVQSGLLNDFCLRACLGKDKTIIRRLALSALSPYPFEKE